MQRIVYLFRKLSADPINAAQILDRCGTHTIESAKAGKQIASPHTTHAGYIFKSGAYPSLGAPRTMAGDRESVRLVANLLDQV